MQIVHAYSKFQKLKQADIKVVFGHGVKAVSLESLQWRLLGESIIRVHNHFRFNGVVYQSVQQKSSNIKMSRFFTAGDSSSESSSSDEEDLYSDQEPHEDEEESSEEEEEEEDEGSSSSDDGGKTGGSRFLRDAASSDESDDEDKVTVVKSAKDKRHEELEGVIKLIENASKIGDWSTISTGRTSLGFQSIHLANASWSRI